MSVKRRRLVYYTIGRNEEKLPFIFSRQSEEDEYVFICEKLWGGVPMDVAWAQGTNSYKEELEKLINKPKQQ